MKLLVFGADSQLGRELTNLLTRQKIDYVALTSVEINLLSRKDVVKAVSGVNPTQVINVTASADLEQAEADAEMAKEYDIVNVEGVSTLAEVCEILHLSLIYHSSSLVFDGAKVLAYVESDEANPVSRYGLSKWSGERALRETLERHIILRSDWLFSPYKNAFFKANIAACKNNAGKIAMMNRRFSPTPAADVARVIVAIAQQLDCQAEVWGTYHYSAIQPVGLEQFTEYMLNEAAKYDEALLASLDSLEIEIVEVEKPYILNSSLSCEKIKEIFGIKPRSRAEEVVKVLQDLYLGNL